jgi:hypothetical protein
VVEQSAIYRHTYRQFLRLQGIAHEQSRLQAKYFCCCFKELGDARGRVRTFANGDVAGELGFEPRFSESESDVLPLNYSPKSTHINGLVGGRFLVQASAPLHRLKAAFAGRSDSTTIFRPPHVCHLPSLDAAQRRPELSSRLCHLAALLLHLPLASMGHGRRTLGRRNLPRRLVRRLR